MWEEETHSARIAQARRWYELGAGRALGFSMFSTYLETIPQPPQLLEIWQGRFDRLVLVEGRLTLYDACALADLVSDRQAHANNIDLLVPCDLARPLSGVRWMWCHDGRRNKGRKPSDVRENFARDEVGLDAIEGVSLYVVIPRILEDHWIDLPSSILSFSDFGISDVYCACIGEDDAGCPALLTFPNVAHTFSGSACRGDLNAVYE